MNGPLTRPRSDDGFTLIEMLLVVVILGVIALPLCAVVMSYLDTSVGTSARLTESQDEQIAESYWQQDVASMGVRGSWNSASNSFPLQTSVNVAFPCSVPSGAQTVVTIGWTEFDPAGSGAATAVVVAYVQQGSTLSRLQCVAGALTSTATLAAHVSGTPAVTCADLTGAAVSCTGSGSAVPATLALRFTVADVSGRGLPYTATLTGQRRST